MAEQILPPLNADMLREITYISGFEADGRVAATSSAAYKSETRTYGPTAIVLKWGGGLPDANGAPTGPNPTAGTPGGTVTYAFVGEFSAAERATYAAGLQAWENVANIRFAPAASVETADATFRRGNDGQAFYDSDGSVQPAVGATRIPQNVGPYVSIDMRPISQGGFGNFPNDYSDGGASYLVTVHEIGHLIGLGHGGPYNEDGKGGGNAAPASQFTRYDQQPYSIMSYIDPSDPTARFVNSYDVRANYGSGTGVANYPVTPQMLDILAIQRIYGAATTGPLTQAQTFGFNTTITDATRTFFDFSFNTRPVVTIYDSAPSGNVLDLSGFAQAATVDLNPGAFSSVGGLTNNLGIAYGTTIGQLIGGTGADRLSGTGSAETILGGAGNDTIFGLGGADLLLANLGDDLVFGNQGADTLFGGQGGDTLFGGQDTDRLFGNIGDDLLLGNLGDDQLFGGQGNDVLFGGQGNDVLSGDLGDDVLSGDLGADRYVFGLNSGADLILGFDRGQGDTLDFQGQTYTVTSASNGDALLRLSGGGTVELAGITAAQFSAGA